MSARRTDGWTGAEILNWARSPGGSPCHGSCSRKIQIEENLDGVRIFRRLEEEAIPLSVYVFFFSATIHLFVCSKQSCDLSSCASIFHNPSRMDTVIIPLWAWINIRCMGVERRLPRSDRVGGFVLGLWFFDLWTSFLRVRGK